MWIPSSPCKNRVSDRGRIDIFSRGSVSGWKAPLMLLALASFSIVCAASGLPEGCVNLDTCFATDSDELKDGPLDYIRFEDGKITWMDQDAKKPGSEIDVYLYTRIVQKCGKLSFSMSKPDNLGDDCNFSMFYGDECNMDIAWKKDDRQKVDLKFYYKAAYVVVGDVSEANVDLDGAILTCKTKKKDPGPEEGFCPFETSKDGDWCRFKFAFKKTGSCDGKIQFDTDYKLLATPAPTTVAPKPTTTPDANYEKTTPGVDAAGLSPWIIAAIVVGVLFLLCCIVGIVACLWCRRCKRRRLTKKMAENGYGSDYECETVVSSHSSLQTAIRMNEERRSSTGNAEEPKSRKKRKTKGTRRLHFQKKEDLKAQPIPVPPRRRKEDLYELLGEPIKPIQPAGEPEKPSAQPSTKTAKPMQHNSINKIPVNNPFIVATSLPGNYMQSEMIASDAVVVATPQNLASPLPSSGDKNMDVEGQLKRGKWSNPIDFIMSMVAFAVGLGNVWRFPYLAHRYGGGTFLLVYSLYFVTVAVPMMVMEASIGQCFGLGATEIWKVFPILKGVGAASVLLCWWVTAYYHVIICWAIFYLISSIRFPAAPLPWEDCSNDWNDNCTCEANLKSVHGNTDRKFETAAAQFFERRVLQNSNSFSELGGVQWEIVIIMAALWILIYFCVWKSLIKARYFVWFSALFPYTILFAMVIRGAILPGAGKGIKAYVTPNFANLINPNLWKDAGSQIFFSYGVGNGGIISLGAYNDFNHNVVRDSIITCFINGGTSIIAGFAVYSTVGFMAQEADISIATLNNLTQLAGPGLGFKIYPEAVLQIAPKQLWSFAFFMMLCLLGLNSQVCLIEGAFSSMEDRFPKLLRVHKKKCLLLFCLFTVCAGQIMVTHAGMIWLNVFDSFGAAGHSLLFVAFFEVVGISWGFGAEKIRHALYEMRGSRPWYIWIILWKYCGPLVIGATFIVSLCFYPGITESLGVSDRPPKWVDVIAYLFSLSSMILIAGYAVYFALTKRSGTSFLQRLREGITTPEGINKERVEKFSLAHDDISSSDLTTSTQSQVTTISSVP